MATPTWGRLGWRSLACLHQGQNRHLARLGSLSSTPHAAGSVRVVCAVLRDFYAVLIDAKPYGYPNPRTLFDHLCDLLCSALPPDLDYA